MAFIISQSIIIILVHKANSTTIHSRSLCSHSSIQINKLEYEAINLVANH
jgi:hypothetical protein